MSRSADKCERRCIKPECQGRIEELLQVNKIWEKDYEELLQQNKRLKAALDIDNTSSQLRRNSPVRYLETSGYLHPASTGSSLNSFTSPQSSLASMSLNSWSTVSEVLQSNSTRSSYNSSEKSSPTQYRKQYESSISPNQPIHHYSDHSTTSRSNSSGQQNVLQRAEGYIQCTVAEIENMKEQIRMLNGHREKEKAEKEKAIEKNKKLKRQLSENEDITFQLHQRIDNLEKKLKKVEDERKAFWEGNNSEQQRKADLMGRGVFPRDKHGRTGYPEERDSTTERQQIYQQRQREFEGGTFDHKHQKLRQIYPLIY